MQKFMADMPFFVETAHRKSFTASAEALGVPVATLSRRIAALEKSLGIQLFHRTTRKVELTEEGESLYKQCGRIVAEAQNVRENILHEQNNPTGCVRLCLPATAYVQYLKGHLGLFSALWPNINLHIHTARHWLDTDSDSEPFDLEIRYGAQPDSSFKIRKLGVIYAGFYATPGFLERYGVPRAPRDLMNMPRVQQYVRSNKVTLYNGAKRETFFLPPPKHIVNSPSLAEELILAGQVFGSLTDLGAQKNETDRRIVRLLPEWRLKGVDIFLIMQAGNMPYRVRLMADYLIDVFKKL